MIVRETVPFQITGMQNTIWHSNLQGLSLTAFNSILHGKRSGVCRNDGIKKEAL